MLENEEIIMQAEKIGQYLIQDVPVEDMPPDRINDQELILADLMATIIAQNLIEKMFKGLS